MASSKHDKPSHPHGGEPSHEGEEHHAHDHDHQVHAHEHHAHEHHAHEHEHHSHEHPHHSQAQRTAGASSVPDSHKARAPRYAKVFVITCSDTRTEATDESGQWLRRQLAERGHVHSGSMLVADQPEKIAAALAQAKAAGAQVALVTGGTGISSRDATFEAITAELERPLPGFGELFRSLSYAQIGSAAMLSRAVAGVRKDGLLVFAMPGSPGAVRLAGERLIFPELTHLLEELAR